ncbi:hypothetical protein [Rurimicrobium arvi]|uniref:Uncharacterized protein n=1 Tax=Rurimicrobium arvi TaxID=2049916 RepID=A0ABP8MKX1_9BACT
MRLYSFLLSFLLIVSGLPSQAQRVMYSDYNPFDLRNGSVAVIGKINGSLFTFRSSGKEYFLDTYNDSMDHIATIVLDFFPDKTSNIRFISYTDRMLVLYQQQSGTRITQYAAMLDSRGILIKNPLKVDEKRSGFFGSSDNEFFSSAVSEDKRNLVIYRADTKGKSLNFDGYWLDVDKMKIIKRAKLKYKAGNTLDCGQALLNNNGDFFLPAYTIIGSRSYTDEYAMLTIKHDESVFRVTELAFEDHYMEYPFQKINNQNGNIYVASFYSTEKNGNNEGVAAATFNMNTLTFDDKAAIPFEDEMRGDTKGKRRERAFNLFRINQLIIKNDGGFLVAAEEYYMTTQSAYMPGVGFYSYYFSPVMAQTVREYHYNDILVLSYNAAKKEEWHTFVRKEQYSQEDGGMFSSYTLLNTGGALGFLFNDFNSRRSRIELSSVAADGSVNTGFMDSGSDTDPDWVPREGKQVDSREIVIPCLRKKQICFAKIVL